MINIKLARGISAGALAALLPACGHLPIAKPAFDAMKEERGGMPTNWIDAEMTGDTSAILADYSVFNDPQLISYVQEALKNNRTIRSSIETLRQSELSLQSTRGGLFPQVSASVGYTDRQTPDNPLDDPEDPTYSSRLGATYSVDIMGDLSASIRSQAAGFRSTQAVTEQTRRQIAAQTVRAYFAVIEQQLQLALERRSFERSQQTFRIVETRFSAGSIDQGEFVNGQAQLRGAEDAILAAENSARASVRALEVILGRFPQNKLAIEGTLPEPPPTPALGLPELTIRSRPNVVAAELRMIQTFANQRRASMAPWPQLGADLSAIVSSGGTSTDELFDFDDLALTLGASLAQTIFDGGVVDARVKSANSQVRQALIQYGQTVIDAYAEIVTAVETFKNLESRQRATQARYEAQAQVLRLNELKYQEGSVSLFELIQQQDAADSAESSMIQLRRSRIDQWITLHTALGGNPTAPTPINNPKNVADQGQHD
jgi:NodT family efflux transporter outer membrane factor (OMF) lipoprotein